MGWDVRYEFVTERSRLDTLVHAAAYHMARRYAEAFRADPQHTEGVAMLFARTDDVEAYLKKRARADHRPRGQFLEGARAMIGLVYLRLLIGHRFVRLTFTAATDDISAVLASSAGLRAMKSIAKRGAVTAAFQDLEDEGTWGLVHPAHRGYCARVPSPRRRTEFDAAAVDAGAMDALRLANVRVT
jgi:hypothetical protein